MWAAIMATGSSAGCTGDTIVSNPRCRARGSQSRRCSGCQPGTIVPSYDQLLELSWTASPRKSFNRDGNSPLARVLTHADHDWYCGARRRSVWDQCVYLNHSADQPGRGAGVRDRGIIALTQYRRLSKIMRRTIG